MNTKIDYYTHTAACLFAIPRMLIDKNIITDEEYGKYVEIELELSENERKKTAAEELNRGKFKSAFQRLKTWFNCSD